MCTGGGTFADGYPHGHMMSDRRLAEQTMGSGGEERWVRRGVERGGKVKVCMAELGKTRKRKYTILYWAVAEKKGEGRTRCERTRQEKREAAG